MKRSCSLKKYITFICLLPLITFAMRFDESEITKTIQNSEETRKVVSKNNKERTPANSSIDNWNDFEKVMKDDNNWENSVNSLIEEYE